MQLAQIAAGLEEPSVRPVAVADIHLTLVPPWNEFSTRDAIEQLGGVATRFAWLFIGLSACRLRSAAATALSALVDCAATSEITTLHVALLQACADR